MSQDQRPAKVRAVATSSAATSAIPADGDEQQAAADAALPLPLPPVPAKGSSLSGKIVFLLGCAAGGAGLAALPHFVPVRF